MTKQVLKYLYQIKQLSTRKIGKLYKTSHVTILTKLNKFHIKRRNHIEANRLHKILFPKCLDCNKELSRRDAKRCEKCSKIYKCKENHPMWKGGKPKCKCGKQLSTYKVQRCISCWNKLNKGKNHYNWQNGISKFPYSFAFTKELKEFIRQRDKYECQLCHKSQRKELNQYNKKLSVHHIDYNKQNCKKDNLITLCNQCNHRVNAFRDYWFAYFNYIINSK